MTGLPARLNCRLYRAVASMRQDEALASSRQIRDSHLLGASIRRPNSEYKKMLKALKNLPFFTCTILNFEEKFDEKMLKTAFQRE